MKFKKKAPEVIFLREVESAIKTHDADKLMSYMEHNYKRSQHDEFLAGRTIQFLNEFLWCEGLIFNEIIDAQLIRYTQMKDDKNQYEVRFYLKSAKVECYANIYMVRHPETNVLSIFGAVG
ncbi:MAG: hypothetical protein IPO32_06630 [Crocinitomicaceae bacterium]|nr:hypothetical protein [Crocinitomicaceae bacterium]